MKWTINLFEEDYIKNISEAILAKKIIHYSHQ